MKHQLLAASLLVPVLWCASASAAVDYELKIDTITGGSTAVGYAGWIDVDSFSWGLTNVGSTGGSAGKAAFQDFAWTQGVDSSVVPIFLGVATGKIYKTAELDVIRTGTLAQPFFEMIYGNAMLTGLNVVGSGDDSALMANASLDYNKVTLRYRSQQSDGSYGTWIEGSFSLVNNAVSFTGDANVLTGLFESGGSFDLAGVPAATSPAAVPEPGSWMLLLGGLGALGWAARRRASTRAWSMR